MKKFNLITIISLGLIIVTTFIISCKKNLNDNEKSKFDKISSIETINKNFSINESEFANLQIDLHSQKILYRKFDANDIFNIYYNINVPEKNIENIVENLIGFKTKIHSIAIYLNDSLNLSVKPNIDLNNILAIGLYFQVENQVYHKLFYKVSTEFIENKQLKAESTNASSSHMLFILKYYVNSNLGTKSLLILRNENRKLAISGKELLKVKFASKIANYIKENNYKGQIVNSAILSAPKGGDGTPKGCGAEPGCENGSSWGEQCNQTPLGNYQCNSIICLLNDSKTTVINEDTLSSSQIDEMFDDDSGYIFRDQFLQPSYLGYKYVAYYYAISEILNGNIDLTYSLKLGSALISFYPKIEKLMNPSGHESEILVSINYRNILTDLINDTRNYSNDEEFIAILDDLQNDLDWFQGKTVSQILAYF